MDVSDHPNSIHPLMTTYKLLPYDRFLINSLHLDYSNSSLLETPPENTDRHQFCAPNHHRSNRPESAAPKYAPNPSITRLLRSHGALLNPVQLEAQDHDHLLSMQGLMVNQGSTELVIRPELGDKASILTNNECRDNQIRADKSSLCARIRLQTPDLSTDGINNRKHGDQCSGIKSNKRKTKKRSRSEIEKRVVFVPAPLTRDDTNTASCVASDNYAWRKYGQKPIKGSPYPRGYYRCSTVKGCPAKKQVERNPSNPVQIIVTYSFEHNHDQLAKDASRSKFQYESRNIKPYEDNCDDLQSVDMDKSHIHHNAASEGSCGPGSSLENNNLNDELNHETSRDDESKVDINKPDKYYDTCGTSTTPSRLPPSFPGTFVIKGDDEFFSDLAWILEENSLDETTLADSYTFTMK